jgi:tetratricopeptide (TPR) repeat protein
MIVRNSSRTLSACLESIRPWVDEMIIVDTGSTDDTVEIATSFSARVFHFPWCDHFAAARNESLKHVSHPWVFWMDSDDVISADNGQALRALGSRPPQEIPRCFVMQVVCPASAAGGCYDITTVDHVKMFPSHPEIRFEWRIHEQILPSIRRLGGEVEWTEIQIVHAGADQSREGRFRKYERDLRLLELDLRDRPDHPFVLFNLGMTYVDMEDFEAARGPLERCLTLADPDESHLRKAYALLVGTYCQLGLVDKAKELCQQGRTLYPEDGELLFRAALICFQQGDVHKAKENLEELLLQPRARYFSSLDRGILGFKARHNLALAHSELGDQPRAELEWRRVLAEMPSFEPARRGLLDCLLRQRKHASAQIEAHRMAQQFQDDDGASTVDIAVYEAEGRIEDARRFLSSRRSQRAWDSAWLHVAARFSYEHGPWEEAVGNSTLLCQRFPGDGSAFHNLGSLYAQKELWRLAAGAYRQSLAVRPESAEARIQLDQMLRQLGNEDEVQN